MFNIETVKTTAQEATNKLITEIKANGFDRDYIAEFKDGVEFKVYIQREQINCALSCESLRKWLDSFFKAGGDQMNAFESEFFSTVYDFAQEHPLFTDIEHIHTQMWIIDEVDQHSPNAVFYAYAEAPTDYETPDYESLEKVMNAAYGLLVLSHTWLDAKRNAVVSGQPLVVS